MIRKLELRRKSRELAVEFNDGLRAVIPFDLLRARSLSAEAPAVPSPRRHKKKPDRTMHRCFRCEQRRADRAAGKALSKPGPFCARPGFFAPRQISSRTLAVFREFFRLRYNSACYAPDKN